MLHRIGLKEMLLCPEDFHRDDVPSSLALFNNIKCSLDSQRWQDVVSLYMGQSHSRHFTVPFQCVTYLVSKRQVILERGMARVPFCKLREVLKEHFKSLMSLATRQACRHHFTAIQDVRMKQLWLKLKVKIVLESQLYLPFIFYEIRKCYGILLNISNVFAELFKSVMQ